MSTIATATKTDQGWAAVCKAEGHIIDEASTRDGARQIARQIEICDDCTAYANAADEQEILEAEESDPRSEILAAIEATVLDQDIQERNRLIREARDAKIRRRDIAAAAGVSVNYLQHILNPQPRPRRAALTKFQQGYQEALASIAALAVSGKTRDESLLLIEEWIQNNRLDAAAEIFDTIAREHGVA